MSNYFPELHSHFHGNVKVKLDFFNYAIKYKKATGVNPSTFTKKVDLVENKMLRKLEIEKLKTITTYLNN